MKLTRKQELHLIDLGLHVLIERALQPTVNAKPAAPVNGRWTKAQHSKFKATMKRKWNEKKKTAKTTSGGS